MHEGYCSCLVCLCVCRCLSVGLLPLHLLQCAFTAAIIDTHRFLVSFPWILTHGFSKHPSILELWPKKANNMLIFGAHLQPFLCIFWTSQAQDLLHQLLCSTKLLAPDEMSRRRRRYGAATGHYKMALHLTICVEGFAL